MVLEGRNPNLPREGLATAGPPAVRLKGMCGDGCENYEQGSSLLFDKPLLLDYTIIKASIQISVESLHLHLVWRNACKIGFEASLP